MYGCNDIYLVFGSLIIFFCCCDCNTIWLQCIAWIMFLEETSKVYCDSAKPMHIALFQGKLFTAKRKRSWRCRNSRSWISETLYYVVWQLCRPRGCPWWRVLGNASVTYQAIEIHIFITLFILLWVLLGRQQHGCVQRFILKEDHISGSNSVVFSNSYSSWQCWVYKGIDYLGDMILCMTGILIAIGKSLLSRFDFHERLCKCDDNSMWLWA